MGAHPKAFVRLRNLLCQVRTAQRTRTPGTREYTMMSEYINKYLDEWYDYTHRATEYDAQLWGFNPDRWMYRERRSMENTGPVVKGMDGRWYARQR